MVKTQILVNSRSSSATTSSKSAAGYWCHAAPLQGSSLPRMVNQDSPHQLGSDSKELGAVPPVGPLLIYKFDVGFLHKGRGL